MSEEAQQPGPFSVKAGDARNLDAPQARKNEVAWPKLEELIDLLHAEV